MGGLLWLYLLWLYLLWRTMAVPQSASMGDLLWLYLLWLYLLWLYLLWRTVLAVTGLPRVAVRQPPPRLERDHLGEVDQAHHRLARRRQQPVGGRNGGGRTGGGRRGRGLRLPPVSVVHEEQRDTNELMLEEPG